MSEVSMNSHCVYFVVDLTIEEEKFDDFQRMARTMIEGRESGALAYEWFLSKDEKRCRLIEVYANPEAVQAHLNGHVVQQLEPKLLAFCTINRFEVYGVPDPKSAAALKGLGAEIYSPWHGLSEQPTSPSAAR
jgi:quinol monooxygenase YgiN